MDRLSEAINSVKELLGYTQGGYPPGKSPFADDPHRWKKTKGDDAVCPCQGEDPEKGYDHIDPTKRQYLAKSQSARIRPMVLTYTPRR